MSITMDEEIKRWTARRKSALVLEIIQGKKLIPRYKVSISSPKPSLVWIGKSRLLLTPEEGC